jgi:hypothetical protein
MDNARWNELIEHAAATAVDEAGDAPTIQAVALRAARLGAEWAVEAVAIEDGDQLAQLKDLYRRYLPPDSEISKDEFLGSVIEILDAKARKMGEE